MTSAGDENPVYPVYMYASPTTSHVSLPLPLLETFRVDNLAYEPEALNMIKTGEVTRRGKSQLIDSIYRELIKHTGMYPTMEQKYAVATAIVGAFPKLAKKLKPNHSTPIDSWYTVLFDKFRNERRSEKGHPCKGGLKRKYPRRESKGTEETNHVATVTDDDNSLEFDESEFMFEVVEDDIATDDLTYTLDTVDQVEPPHTTVTVTHDHTALQEDEPTTPSKVVKIEQNNEDDITCPGDLIMDAKSSLSCCICGRKKAQTFCGTTACRSCITFFIEEAGSLELKPCNCESRQLDHRLKIHCQMCMLAQCYDMGMRKSCICGRPRNLKLAVGDNCLVLKWDPPMNADGELDDITGYAVYELRKVEHCTVKTLNRDLNHVKEPVKLLGVDVGCRYVITHSLGKGYRLCVKAVRNCHESPEENLTITDVTTPDLGRIFNVEYMVTNSDGKEKLDTLEIKLQANETEKTVDITSSSSSTSNESV